jgi:putative acetyltransferase
MIASSQLRFSSCIFPRRGKHRTFTRIMASSSLTVDDHTIAVRPALSPHDMEAFRQVNKLYLDWLNEDLGFQGVDEEMATLPGNYGPASGGCMLVAYAAYPTTGGGEAPKKESVVGVVALRTLTGKHIDGLLDINNIPIERICEMKRLFVLPEWQRRGVGNLLVDAILTRGKEMGYELMVLDTLERLHASNALYAKMGFEACTPYSLCPLEGPLWFSKRLL